MLKNKLNALIQASFALAVAILLTIGWLSVQSLMTMMRFDRWTKQTYEEMQELERFLFEVKELEAEQYGYIITGNPNYLESFTNAAEDANRKWLYLIKMAKGNFLQQQRLVKIKQLISEFLGESQKVIQLRKTRGFQAAYQALMVGKSRTSMDAIQQQVAEDQDDEEWLLWQRSKTKNANIHFMTLTAITGGVLGLAMICAVVYFLQNEVTRRMSVENDLFQQKEHLQDLVEERTRELKGLNVQLKSEIESHEQAENSLHQSEIKLRESDRRKDEFMAMLAHELRNPLAPIRNAAYILKTKNPSDAQLQRQRDTIERQVSHMTRLLEDLLDLSRIAQGLYSLNKQPVAVKTILSQAIEASSPSLKARDHVLHADWPPADLRVEGDPDRLVQIVTNLLSNAAKYTDKAGRIELSARRENGQAVIRVRDNGMGIDPSMLDKIFDMFAQADLARQRSQGGLGIGLTLVRNLVALHGGTVEAQSAGPGQGSEFTVRLPALP